jgi:hypothetical protein
MNPEVSDNRPFYVERTRRLLRDNCRGQGNVHEWVARNFYNGQMNVVNKDRDLNLLDDWTRDAFCSVLLLNLIQSLSTLTTLSTPGEDRGGIRIMRTTSLSYCHTSTVHSLDDTSGEID